MERNKFAFQSTIAAPPTMFSLFILVPNMHKSINMTPARESRTGRKVRGERRFPIYRQTITFLWFYRIRLTSQNIIRRLKLSSVLTCCSLTPSGLILGLCDGLVSDSEGYLWTHLFFFLLCSLHLRLGIQEKSAFFLPHGATGNICPGVKCVRSGYMQRWREKWRNFTHCEQN